MEVKSNYMKMWSSQITLRPHDVVVLLKICSLGNNLWLQQSLADTLFLSQSEISKSLARVTFAGLAGESGKNVHKRALLEFLQYGIAYAFPVRPGPLTRGIPTAHSASPLNKFIVSEEAYVWPSVKGQLRGQAIIPLYGNVVKAVQNDPELHEVLALIDALRVGRAREKQFATSELKKRLCE